MEEYDQHRITKKNFKFNNSDTNNIFFYYPGIFNIYIFFEFNFFGNKFGMDTIWAMVLTELGIHQRSQNWALLQPQVTFLNSMVSQVRIPV